MAEKCSVPCNKNAQQCVKNVMEYLADISGKKMLTGQHTQTMAMEEISYIKDITGDEPALIGFELLSYSPNIDYIHSDSECLEEVTDNLGTLRRAWEWAERGGLITFTWHWFSPLGGSGKSFFSCNTDFDARLALKEGTRENHALISDMDVMAGLLRPFCQAGIPILWRPFHEGEGDWFWWGGKLIGDEALKDLYGMMYDRFTDLHGLNNLIWVWNSPNPSQYPGNERVDIISRDMYPPKHCHTAQLESCIELAKIASEPKITIIGETGTLPDTASASEQAGWASYMTWSKDFCTSGEFTDEQTLRRIYSDEHSVTKSRLPRLWNLHICKF